MKTITGVLLITALVAGCTKNYEELPDCFLTRSLKKRELLNRFPVKRRNAAGCS
jgi:hypothetical protein